MGKSNLIVIKQHLFPKKDHKNTCKSLFSTAFSIKDLDSAKMLSENYYFTLLIICFIHFRIVEICISEEDSLPC